MEIVYRDRITTVAPSNVGNGLSPFMIIGPIAFPVDPEEMYVPSARKRDKVMGIDPFDPLGKQLEQTKLHNAAKKEK